MSQARKIYEFLVRTRQTCAEPALLLALDRAEEPYQTALLETILERGGEVGTSKLIGCYHEYSLPWQQILLGRAESLSGGLRAAAGDERPQTRLNVLRILRQRRLYARADLVIGLLGDVHPTVAQEAAKVLLELAKSFRNEAAPVTGTAEPGDSSDRARAGDSPRHRFLQALQTGVRNYRRHRRIEAVLAGMYVAEANDKKFWDGMLEPYDLVGRIVRQLMVTFAQPELAGFCISALADSRLRGTAARAIAVHSDRGFILEVARCFAAREDDALRRGLQLVQRPVWLSREGLPAEALGPEEHEALLAFVSALGAPPEQRAEYLCSLAQAGSESVAYAAVARMAALPMEAVSPALSQAVRLPYESAALSALETLRAIKSPLLPQIMAAQLTSPHPTVREQAQGYFQERAFRAYWGQYERLSEAQRRAAGQAVFKLDRRAQARWRVCAGHRLARMRLRAVRMARLLGRSEECADVLLQLVHDPDPMVRSCVVAALGQTTSPAVAEPTEQCLIEALEDPDHRVCANAVEALDHRNVGRAAERIADFLDSANSRLRANAIKAQLNWKVATFRRAIDEMLHDPRPPHRQSARWVVRQTHNRISCRPYVTESADGIVAGVV